MREMWLWWCERGETDGESDHFLAGHKKTGFAAWSTRNLCATFGIPALRERQGAVGDRLHNFSVAGGNLAGLLVEEAHQAQAF